MKKRLFTSILSVLLLVILSVFGLVGCGTTEETKKTLSLDVTAKEITVGESFTLTATATPADAEIIWSSSDETIVTVTDGTVLGVSVGTATVTAKNDTETATCEITVKAAETQTYTVIFKNGETELKTEQVVAGNTVSYNGIIPSKAATQQYAYTFSGWATSVDGEVIDLSAVSITEDKIFYAVFAESVREYGVTWNIDGVPTEEIVAYGAIPQYKGATPTKPTVGNTSYTFIGWKADLSGEVLETLPAVTGDVTYYAAFDEVTAQTKFTVIWMNGDAAIETDTDVEYETMPSYDGEIPTKPSTEDVEYTFIGWATSADGEVLESFAAVTADVTYYATFAETELEAPKFDGGKIMFSDNSEEIFLPEGLLEEGVSIENAVVKTEEKDEVVAYENGAWIFSAIALTEEEYKGNLIGMRRLEVVLSDGAEYTVDMDVYAGIIDELADFPKFFNNTAVPSEFDPTTYPAVAPNVYGYYIVTKDLGSATDELALDQVEGTDYQKTNGFNGVLDGQGHTLRFKLTKGALVGFVLGNAVIKNLGVIYEDATVVTRYDEAKGYNVWVSGGYGVFGYVTNGAPEIRNCYIEKTNNHYMGSTVFGIMARPNKKLIMHNTVVYAYNTSNNANLWGGNMFINETSTNAYLIHARANATGYANVQNMTKVFNDALENGSREVLLSEIEDASGFDNNYWYKENGKLIWKGLELATVTWVKGEETITETATKGGWIFYTQTLPEDSLTETESISYYWSLSEDGEKVKFEDRFIVKEDTTYYMVEKTAPRTYTVTWVIDGNESTTEVAYNETATHETPVKAEDDSYAYEFKGWALSEDGEIVELGAVTGAVTYYAVFEKTVKVTTIAVNQPLMYSSNDGELFLPEELNITLDADTKITSADGVTTYYENGAWVNSFALTEEQIKTNQVGVLHIRIEKGADLYSAKVHSYAGVIDEFADFPKFFNNTAVASEFDPATYPAVAPNTYGYYIVTKDLGSYTGTDDKKVFADTLTFDQVEATDYKPTNGFNGVLDGAGHTLKFKLAKGGLVGLVLGNAVIKNIAVIYEDASYEGDATKKGGYGVFGYITNGAPEIRNSYIERVNLVANRGSVLGIMARPNARLTLHNTVVYGFRVSNDGSWNSSPYISAASTNAYVVGARVDAKVNMSTHQQVKNFTKVYEGGTGSDRDSRGVLLADIAAEMEAKENAKAFDTNYWAQENENLVWKGAADMVFFATIKAN